ncbi:hypothetical protein CEXT_248011 [Caerostris extrusa]|uniref:Uncharacterized protein n=1 Tax=Caerostris extrusa TaxID=172846 RepID=A0AAV4TDG4_CAEEX|nr:hypothetical protein CEXT_248011 [Caerostris extrusa]
MKFLNVDSAVASSCNATAPELVFDPLSLSNALDSNFWRYLSDDSLVFLDACQAIFEALLRGVVSVPRMFTKEKKKGSTRRNENEMMMSGEELKECENLVANRLSANSQKESV